ncbi:sugar ABC transporter permease [Paenibacillus sp. GP183]|jgi:raffinose/stachyose/melibiose transport system permease protein|uniref:carbohydrate ABC transporter permease n=1 Tax=Paenibacillus sp. GP183 TaxID=1882751 RepID=UPI000894C3BF|nr:sugar ABC transporter permease [Paenibacillus sp. GP183]SEC67312.1 carbohydrate ABC transporter membrane protein 1, CUT1 family [Paenibacillus sp. GP183]
MSHTLKNPYVYLMFILPTILLYFMFFIYPMLSSVYYGFTNWDGLNVAKFNGFDNFSKAFKDQDFWNAVRNNLYFIFFSVFIQIPLIILFALLISSVKRFQGFYKTTVFMPSILSTAVVGILWGFIYEPEVGIVNQILGKLGIDKIYWLADEKWAMMSVLFTNAWQWMGFYIVLVLAAILSIPKEIGEAAAIDGATGFQRAFYLTLPLIKPIISVIIMLSIAGALRVIDIVLVMTNGGPAGATEVMASYMVSKAVSTGDYGYGTALSLLIFAFALVLTALYQIVFGRNSERIEF